MSQYQMDEEMRQPENPKRKREGEVLSDDEREEEQAEEGFEEVEVTVEATVQEDRSYDSSPPLDLEEQCRPGMMAPGDSITYRVLMEHLSKMAIEKYNKYMKTNVEFKDILRATRTLCNGINYFIRFRVKDLSALEDNVAHFEALVNKFGYECEVVFCYKDSDGEEEGYNICIHDYPES